MKKKISMTSTLDSSESLKKLLLLNRTKYWKAVKVNMMLQCQHPLTLWSTLVHPKHLDKSGLKMRKRKDIKLKRDLSESSSLPMKYLNPLRSHDTKRYSSKMKQEDTKTKKKVLRKLKLFKSPSHSMKEMRRKGVRHLILLMI